MTTTATISNADISSEVIDDEVMIMDLSNGRYYSLQGAGMLVWESLRQGVSIQETINKCLDRYQGDVEEISGQVNSLVEELVAQGLVTLEHDGKTETELQVSAEREQNGIPFANCQLNVYTDMEDLLLLDPIHDVDAKGWPHRSATDQE